MEIEENDNGKSVYFSAIAKLEEKKNDTHCSRLFFLPELTNSTRRLVLPGLINSFKLDPLSCFAVRRASSRKKKKEKEGN